MTNETRKPNAPAEANPQGQGKRELAAGQQNAKPNPRWPARFLAVAGIGVAAAFGSACGGEGVSNELPPIPTPAGVCANIAARISEEGNVRLGLDEAKLALGGTAHLTDDALVKVDRMVDTASGTKVTLKLVDKDGNSLANILDPADGSTIPATSDGLGPGQSWTFVVDGTSYTLTVCAIMHTEDGDYVILSASPGYDWCAPIERTVPAETTTYETNTYGTETINAEVKETGEEARGGRNEAGCAAVSREVISESAELEVPMEPGVQPEDSRVLVLGEVWKVIELDASGEVLLGKSIVSDSVEVGERLITGLEGLELLVTQVANYDGTYKADLVVSVPGFELELVEGAVAGTLLRVRLPGGDAYVRVNEVNADGTVRLEVLGQTRTMRDGGTWASGGSEYSVSLDAEGSNVAGWTLTKQ